MTQEFKYLREQWHGQPKLYAKFPYWKLSSDGSETAAYSSFVHKKPNLTQMKQEFKYLREQWHGQPKLWLGQNVWFYASNSIFFEILPLQAQND